MDELDPGSEPKKISLQNRAYPHMDGSRGARAFVRVRHLVGRGHCEGRVCHRSEDLPERVWIAARWLRALMKSAGARVQINGTHSQVLRFELG